MKLVFVVFPLRIVLKYQRGNHNAYIEEQTMAKRKSTKGQITTIYKTYT
jgi:hypothetical protein